MVVLWEVIYLLYNYLENNAEAPSVLKTLAVIPQTFCQKSISKSWVLRVDKEWRGWSARQPFRWSLDHSLKQAWEKHRKEAEIERGSCHDTGCRSFFTVNANFTKTRGVYNEMQYISITSSMIKFRMRTLKGSGPSGFSINAWKIILSKTKFEEQANDMCNTITKPSKRRF